MQLKKNTDIRGKNASGGLLVITLFVCLHALSVCVSVCMCFVFSFVMVVVVGGFGIESLYRLGSTKYHIPPIQTNLLLHV